MKNASQHLSAEANSQQFITGLQKPCIYVPRHQRGLTLLEGLAWMALAGVVVAGALAMNAKGWLGNKEQKEITHISSLISGTKQLQSVNGYGASGTNLVPALISADLVPGDMTVSGTTLTNRFGGTVTVTSTGLGYTVTDPSLPASACMSLARQISQIGGLTTKIGSGAAATGAVDTATAQAQCSGSANTVAFTMAN
ncbi:hypothetical protein LMG31884_47380 (plasmid) [Xanthomonas hydrangeae]|uniref:type 4 pilus major pilin n=1 Tax=Xanthomonas hydrangeae TaxID=2775159 RepID=UPI0019655402|nr:hypothetical protein LMG31884_47380 [Xanthomonas hydrangeae]CAD7741182.1 hypothetical protein LMG31884_47380 [Xanthomonas hydrangeae]CAD7747944.1 hypothetical protein LMG31887_46430 [Xanthomonas hydrangeae]CAD7747945.1 hypothetical protein LMG31887_46430 [Xanthomonas hydrangeae]CAD7748178.1 hypothetical protein LMG31885_45060 [Xanthomonas hydrangeae]